MSGVSLASTACSSASDSKKKGIEKALKLRSIRARPVVGEERRLDGLEARAHLG